MHPLQKSFCVLFITLAFFIFFIHIRKPGYEKNKAFPDVNYLLYEELFDDGNNLSYPREIIFDVVELLNSTLELHNGSNITLEHDAGDDVIYVLGLFDLTTAPNRQKYEMNQLAAAQLAVRHVNALNILPGYKLVLLINDTQCDPGVAIDRLFHAIYSSKTILTLLGSGCSNVSEALAHIVPYWNIIQVSYGSESPALSDRRQFPLFFRTAAPDSSRNIAKSLFIKHFNWKVVAAFSQSENRYLLPVNHLITELEKQNISCVSTVTFSYENYREQLEVLKRLDVRIIIGSFSTSLAPFIFCTVYALGMYGKEYVWILENQKSFWWHDNSNCSQFQLLQAVDGVIMIGDYQRYPFNLMQLTDPAKNSYDALWAIALSLRISEVENLHLFSYRDFNVTQKIFEAMSRLEFIGVSGPVKFKGADRLGDFQVGQIQGGMLNVVALYDAIIDNLMWDCHVCSKVSWHNGNIPMAQRIVKTSLVMIPKSLFYATTAISFAGISCSVVFLYFNLKFRELKTIKLSSPNLNNLAVVGCVLVYLSVILFGLNSVNFGTKSYFDELCVARIYLLSAGFSLTFGSMFAKSYRVHRLFTYTTTTILKDKLLKDQQLIGLILIPLVVDVITIALWMVTDPLKRHLLDLVMQISNEDPRIVYQLQGENLAYEISDIGWPDKSPRIKFLMRTFIMRCQKALTYDIGPFGTISMAALLSIELCQCTNTIGWHVALFGYKSIILVMAVYMAWKTRHVKISVLNDSQYIGICVYSAVFSTVLVVVFSFVTEYFILSFIIKTISILASATITLILMFLPKLKSLLEAPDEGIMESMGLKLQSNTRRFINEDPKEILFRLEIQNKVFRTELEALDKELAKLEEMLEVSTSNTIRSANVKQIFPDVHYLDVPRASWPIWQSQTIKPFSSDNKLNNSKCREKENFFGRLKKLFGSLASLHQSYNNLEQKMNNCDSDTPRSNPEMSGLVSTTCSKY